MLGSALADRCQTPVVKEVYNKSLIDWVSGQYGETLHSCAAFSLAFGSGKYFCTLVQYLAILTANPVNNLTYTFIRPHTHIDPYIIIIIFTVNFFTDYDRSAASTKLFNRKKFPLYVMCNHNSEVNTYAHLSLHRTN